MVDLVSNYFEQVFAQFINPQKRIFLGYLASALVIALVYKVVATRDGALASLRDIFSSKIWFSTSARADYLVAFINQAIMMGAFTRLLSTLTVSVFLFEIMHTWFDGRLEHSASVPNWVVALVFTASLFLLGDATKYLLHRSLHTVPLLWLFHRIHHSAEVLTPFTVYRTHPVEGILFALRSVLVQGVLLSVFFYFFGNKVEVITILNAHIFVFIFNALGSNLRHSHIGISYGRILERIFISPAQHQVHHSLRSEHFNTNFGAILAIWDWVGGSLCLADRNQVLKFGLLGSQGLMLHNIKSIYCNPVIEAGLYIQRTFLAVFRKMYSRQKLRTSARHAPIYLFGLLGAVFIWLPSASHADSLNIYSHRQPFLIAPFIEAYKKETGTNVEIVYASKGLAQRLQAEGERSPADVVLTVDIARLSVYADKGLLYPVNSEILRTNIPQRLRDPGNRWFSFSKRARIIVVSRGQKELDAITSYEDLADPTWGDRICVRPGSHVYNRALLSSFIEHKGEDLAEAWAEGLVNNLARKPQGNDRAQVRGIFEGVCDIAIINSYYFGKLKNSKIPEQRSWAAAVRPVFPNQAGRGTHVNISGGGVAKFSKNKKEAVRFLEFLTSQTAQRLYSEINFEYPVNPSVEYSKELRSWGTFKEDQMMISRIPVHAAQAQKIIDRVGW